MKYWQLIRACLFVMIGLVALLTPLEANPPGVSVGDKVPEINLPNVQGVNKKLSALKGKVVLLNFWASWCVSCNVVTNPEYKMLWKKYKDQSFKNGKGFEIYSVAFDEDKSKWLEKIREQGLNWNYHVLDDKSFYSNLWTTFDIQSIPFSFLIDEKGKVIGVDLSYDQLDAELAKRKKATQAPPAPTPPPPAPPAPPVTVIEEPDPEPTPPSPAPPSPSPAPAPGNGGNTLPDIDTGANTGGNGNSDGAVNGNVVEQTVYKIQLGASRAPDLGYFKGKLGDLGTIETEAVSATSSLKRVLLGSFSKSGVGSVHSAVKARGFRDAFVVKRQAKVKIPDTPPVAPGGGGDDEVVTRIKRTVYRVQLGVFRQANLAKFNALTPIGSMDVESTSSGLEKVLLGKYEHRSDAASALAKVKAKGFDGFLTTREVYETMTAYAPATHSVETTVSDRGMRPAEFGVPGMMQPELMAMDYADLTGTMINKQVPEVTLPDQEGNTFSLSTLKGKLVLVELWTSRSKDARKNHADMNKLYQKYKSKKFEIYSIGFEPFKKQWMTAIEEDQLSWPIHVVDEQGPASDLLEKFNVEYLPALFLVDKKGVIVAENLSYEQLDEELSIRLGKKK